MKRRLNHIVLLSLISFVVFGETKAAHAQMGVEVGAGYFLQNGILQAPCGCKFDDGKGSGYKISLNYDLVSLLGFTVGAKAGVDRRQFSSSHLWGGGTPTALTDNMLLTTTYLHLEPYVRYNLFAGLFLQAGIGYSYLVHNSYFQQRDLLSGTYSNGSSDSVLENGQLSAVRSSMSSVPISAGYMISLLSLRIAPMITADVPVTNISSVNGYEWNLTSYYASVLLYF